MDDSQLLLNIWWAQIDNGLNNRDIIYFAMTILTLYYVHRVSKMDSRNSYVTLNIMFYILYIFI